ncbi:MAG: hypothetical protein H6965_10260 [Chromatiaceae bacterium]|nr:hypothetical protein [Chromatiaceae bacterium]
MVTPDQIHTVVTTFRDKLFTEIFPGRSEVPKTLFFAKGEAEKGEHPVNVRPAAEFRAERDARVKKVIATGIPVVEVIMFMCDVKSRSFFEQMKGRGLRSAVTFTPMGVLAA